MSKFKGLTDVLKSRRGEQHEGAPDTPVKRTGRPRGKRSDPDFEQVTAYIRKDTYQQVKIALLQQGRSREFSELLEELLYTWLKPAH